MTEASTSLRRGHRWPWIVGVVVGACVGLALALECVSPDATTRLRRHFDLRDVGSSDSIRAGLLSKVPLGTPWTVVHEFLNKAGIGKDGLSSVYLNDAAGRETQGANATEIFCRIEFDPNTFGFVKESYGVSFAFDDQRLLKDIVVHKWLTGL